MSNKSFIPFSIAVLTSSDTRDEISDTSGNYLAEEIRAYGHVLAEKKICPDNIYIIRALVSQWIADKNIQVIIITGGTGLFESDCSPEAVEILYDKKIDGFGELFRARSYDEIGTSSMQSRATAGIANKTLIFVLPGSTNACKLGWNIICEQLDATKKQCSFVNVLTKDKK